MLTVQIDFFLFMLLCRAVTPKHKEYEAVTLPEHALGYVDNNLYLYSAEKLQKSSPLSVMLLTRLGLPVSTHYKLLI